LRGETERKKSVWRERCKKENREKNKEDLEREKVGQSEGNSEDSVF